MEREELRETFSEKNMHLKNFYKIVDIINAAVGAFENYEKLESKV